MKFAVLHFAITASAWTPFSLVADPAPTARAKVPTPIEHGGAIQPLGQEVNPFVGSAGPGSTMPGPTRPHGSIHPSPQTLSPGNNGGYGFKREITGFAQLHVQGTGGTTTYGNFLVSPQVGPVEAIEAKHGSAKTNEVATVSAYSVDLTRYGVHAEVTPAHFSALYRFTFPKSAESQVLIDITRKLASDLKGSMGARSADIQLDVSGRKITGHILTKNQWIPASYDVWFCAKFSETPTAAGVFKNGGYLPKETSGSTGPDQPLAAWFTFDTNTTPLVQMKIAVSFHSAARAEQWLDAEIPAWDWDGVRAATARDWDQSLSAILVEGANPAERARFYTSLYHALIQPRNRTGDNARWVSAEPYWDDHYTLWDTYRTLFPLLGLLRPSDLAGNVRAFADIFEHQGAMETAYIGGQNYRVAQGGDEVDNVIGDAYVKNIPGVDWERAYRLLHFNATQRRSTAYREKGWSILDDPSIPDGIRRRSGSNTLGFAFNDFNVASVAEGLGKKEDAAFFRARAGNWKNVWDASATSDGYTGFIRSRRKDGTFVETDPKAGWDGRNYVKNDGFYEGTSWIYSYQILHDIQGRDGLIERMGGPDKFIERLEHALQTELIYVTNEPSFLTPWLFHFAGRPNLSAKWARKILTRWTDTGYPGDEDSGAMGSHYVWNSIGLFPVVGQPIYLLHGPRWPRITLQMEGGKRFVMEAKNVSPENIYIQSATLNGTPLTQPWLSHSQVTSGGQLSLVMGPQPDRWTFPTRDVKNSPTP